MNFDNLVDNEDTYQFYGVCSNEFKLNETVFEAVEDPDDGYRSYLGSVEVIDSDGIFFSQPLSTVKIVSFDEKFDYGYRLIDAEDGHIWLEIGTGDYNDYYPYFIFYYKPKSLV